MTDTRTITPMALRLNQRMTKLADTASKESIQALAKWIGFRRKHIAALASTLSKAIQNPSTVSTNNNSNNNDDDDNNNVVVVVASTPALVQRQWLYLQILVESILLDAGTPRWERLSDMRDALGEALLSIVQSHSLDVTTCLKLETVVKQQFDAQHVFGGPTLINVLKKELAVSQQPATAVTATAVTAAAAADSVEATKTAQVPTKEEEEVVISPSKESPEKQTEDANKEPTPTPQKNDTQESVAQADVLPTQPTPATSPKHTTETSTIITKANAPIAPSKRSSSKEVDYDFESKNIPYGKVDSKAFIDPCTAIATLQIARDLRNDTAVQLSALLKALPDDIKDLCDQAHAEAKASGSSNKPFELTSEKARELSLRTSEKLLDLDLDEQLQNVQTFLEIVGNQREARQRLILLLIRSRCRFGATEAAEAYLKLDETSQEVKKRKNALLDAMALEGMDFEEEPKIDQKKKKKQSTAEEAELPPLTWYKKDDATTEEPKTKRTKIDSSN